MRAPGLHHALPGMIALRSPPSRDGPAAVVKGLGTVAYWLPTLSTLFLVSLALEQRRSGDLPLSPCAPGGDVVDDSDLMSYSMAMLPITTAAVFAWCVAAMLSSMICCSPEWVRDELRVVMAETGPGGQALVRRRGPIDGETQLTPDDLWMV